MFSIFVPYVSHDVSIGVDTGKKLLTTGEKTIKVHPYSPHWKKNLRICTLNLFAAEISYLYNICRVWALQHAIA